MAKRARGNSTVVLAPEPELMAGQQVPNRVLSVKLKSGEDVEWLWTALPQGGRYVSGYRILDRGPIVDRHWIDEAEDRLSAHERGEL
jgi:hypothetical protein